EARPGPQGERLRLGRELIRRYDRDNSGKLTREEIGLDTESFRRLDRSSDGALDETELARYFLVTPDVEVTAHLGRRGEHPALRITSGTKSTFASKVAQTAPDALTLSLSALQVELRTASGPGAAPVRPELLLEYFALIFRQVDNGNRGFIDLNV